MKNYKKILLAVELIPETDLAVFRKAVGLETIFNSQLVVVHAIEHYPYVYGGAVTIDFENDMLAAAKVMVADIQKQFPKTISSEAVVLVGSAKHVIIDEAKKMEAGLIVLGSHGKHGVRLLLGSTANAVIHAAHCDVLAVRV
jgi:universal stress protein A